MPSYRKSGRTGSGTGRSRKTMGVHDALYAKPPSARNAKQMPRRSGTGGAGRSTMPKKKAANASVRDSRQTPTSKMNPRTPFTAVGGSYVNYPMMGFGSDVSELKKRHLSPNQKKALAVRQKARRMGAR